VHYWIRIGLSGHECERVGVATTERMWANARCFDGWWSQAGNGVKRCFAQVPGLHWHSAPLIDGRSSRRWSGRSSRAQPARFLRAGLVERRLRAASLTPEPGLYSLFHSGSSLGNTRSPLVRSTTITVRSP
jgi:hypothetical protein